MAELSETIPIGEWLPDRADLDSGGCKVAQNVITDGEDYKPFPSFVEQSDAMAARSYGGYSHISADGNTTTFLASRTKIYRLSGASLVDVTNTGADYTTPLDGCWFFTQFGETVIATNYVDKIQKYEIGVDTDFSDLITAGPDVKCRNFGVINNFLVCIDIQDSDGETQNRVRWSPINDPGGNWTSSQTTQSDFQSVEDGNPGQGMAVIGGQNYGVLIFRNAIYRMEYVGPPTIFRFIMMEQGRGAINGQCITSNGRDVFYASENGLWQFDGNQSIPIGQRKVDKYFKDLLDTTYIYNMRMANDPLNKNILLAYTSTAASNGRNDKILCYNWVNQRFTEIDEAVDVLFKVYSPGYTLEEVGAAYPNLDLVPYSLDSRFWQGGATVLGGINQDNKLGYFDGNPMTAYLESQEVRLNTEGLAYVESILPIFESGTCTVRLGARKALNGTVLYTPYQSPSSETGEVNFNNESRYHRAGITLSGSWEHFQGLKFRAGPGGGI